MKNGYGKKGYVCGIIFMMIISIFAITPILVDAEVSREFVNRKLNLPKLDKDELQIINGYYVNNPKKIGRVGAVTQQLAEQSLGVELIELRTPVARHFKIPKGTIMAIISTMPTSYLTDTGKWNDIDSNDFNYPMTRNTNESVCNYYGFTNEVNLDGEDPFLYMYTPPDNYYIAIGWEDGDGVFNPEDWFRGFAQWDTSSIPDNAHILDVGLKFYLSSYTLTPFGDDDWTYHEILLDVYRMSNKPSDYYGDTYSSILHNDAADGTNYYHASEYIYASNSGWKPSSTTYYELDGAEVHLENQLVSNWFAVGMVDYYEDVYDEGVCLFGGNEWLKVEYSCSPTVSPTDVISYPTAMYPGLECTVVAQYHDPDGYEDILYCWLRLDNDAGAPEQYLDMRWEDGGSTYIDPTDSEYITINSVSESSTGTTTTLTWNFMLDWDWTEDTGVDLGLKVEDDHGYFDGWTDGSENIIYENDVHLNDLTVNCSSDWNGGDVEDDDWIGPNDEVKVSGHYYFEDSTVPPPSGEIVVDIYANEIYTGVSDECNSNGFFYGEFTSASNTDLDYLINVNASSIPYGGGESAPDDDGKSARIDADPPSTPDPDDGVEGWSNDNTPTFTWSADDNNSGIGGFYWKIDSGSETWTDSIELTLPEQNDGEHVFYVKAEDKVGNIGDFGEHSFKIDTTPPITTCTLDGIMEGDVYISNVTVTLNATDTHSGVQNKLYKLNEEEWDIYTEPFVVSESGQHTLYYYSVDNADNEEDVNEKTFIIGHSPDKPTIDGPTNGKTGIEYDYTFSSVDIDGDEVFFLIDWGDDTTTEWLGPYASGEEVTKGHIWTEDGTYIIKIKAKDIYDLESQEETFEITIPRFRIFKTFLQWFFERFPNTFPILRYTLRFVL